MKRNLPAGGPRMFAVLALALIAARAAGEPTIELSNPDQTVSLAVAWRFQPGDDLLWADPDFDDGGWREVHIPTGFGRFDAKAKLAWYRLEIQIESSRQPPAGGGSDPRLALTLGKIDSAYEVFVGGIRLGGVGRLPPTPRLDYDRHRTYRVPPTAIGRDGRLVIALRVWKSPYTWGDVGGPHEGPFLLGPEADLVQRELLSELPVLFLAGLFLIGGLFHLELFRRRPQQRGYLWFFCCSTVFAGYAFLRTQWKYMLGDYVVQHARASDYFLLLKEIEYFLLFGLVAGFIQLVWPLLGLRIGPLLRAYQILNLATGLLVALTPGVRLNMLVLPYWELSVLALIVYGLWAIFREAWRKHPEARILAAGTIGSTAAFLNDIAIDRGLIVGPRLVAFGFAFLILALALSLANRFHRTHRELETLRRDLESRVEERTRQLVEASQAKSRFLATMSHEIRTPLNGVLGLTQLMLGTELSPKQRDYARKTLRSGDALLALIDDILDFSKIEAGKIALEARPFLVRDIVEQSLDLSATAENEEGLELSYFIAPETPKAVVGDPDRLRQILVNLIGNAIKFTEQGAVRVKVERRGEQLYFQVRDTGIGIPEDRHDQLFDTFTQIDTADGKLRGGTGLGLAICHRLCEAMGGTIWVKSQVDQGSVFHFTIQAEPTEPPTPVDQAAERSPALSPLRLLLAEDDEVNVTVARGMLKNLGCRAEVVTNGLEVLAALSQQAYDVVLLDIQMPQLDGLETARRIRRKPPANGRPRLIAMTAHATKGDREKCLAAGMDDYLSKPLKLELLRAALTRCTPAAGETQPMPNGEPASAMGQAPSRVLNLEVLEHLRQIDNGAGEVLRDAVATFLSHSPRNLSRIATALTKDDAETAHRLAHGLKTTAGMLGGISMMDLCSELERAADCGALPEARPLLRLAEEEFERLETELRAVPGALPSEI